MSSSKLSYSPRSSWRKRIVTSTCLLVFLLICLLPLLRTSFAEDISAMIPRGENGRIIEDFKLLQKAPMSGNILISISSDKASPAQLIRTAEILTGQMEGSYLRLKDYSATTPQEVINFLLKYRSQLTSADDLEKIKNLTSDETVSTTIGNIKKQLISPTGIGIKNIIAQDPLELRSVYLQKITPLKNLPRLAIQEKHFFNKDKSALLLIATTDIPMTDSKGGAELLTHFEQIKDNTLGKVDNEHLNIDISLLSGHLYTVANADTIKRDVYTVSILSIISLLLIFIFGFRRLGALSILAAPGIAIIAGLGATAYFSSGLSAIVIGFGAVLMGISIDFSVHTWFALADQPTDKTKALNKVSRPILFGAATSCAAFAALYISGIPGIKQLAIFSVAGIVAACAFALLCIPVFCSSFPKFSKKNRRPKSNGKHKTAAGLISALLILVGLATAFSNSFDTDLKNLGYVSDDIRATEKLFQDQWGNLRGKSLLFAKGNTDQEALRNNEKIWADLKNNLPDIPAVSISPLLLSEESQLANSKQWEKFWTEQRIDRIASEVNNAAKEQGFLPSVFDKQIRALPDTGQRLTTAGLSSSPLGFLVDIFIPSKANTDESLILNLLPENNEVSGYYSEQKERELGARLVSQPRFKAALQSEMMADIIKFISCSGLLVFTLVIVLFRNLRRAALALLPAIFGVTATFGILGALGIPLNIFHIVALPLVIGLGADYGIFMVFQEIKTPSASTVKAVIISGLTTLAGFGVLVFAKHPSLYSLGMTVATGVSAAILCAVFILPHMLYQRNGHA